MNNWIFQGVFTSVVAALIWAGSASLLTWIIAKWPKVGNTILYWLGSAVLIGILWFVIAGHPPFLAPPPLVNSDNIEKNIKLWSENLGIPIVRQDVPTGSDFSFLYTVTTKDGLPIEVGEACQKQG
jgi:hypothetical protein